MQAFCCSLAAADVLNLPQFWESVNAKAAVESWYGSVKGISLPGPGQMSPFVFLFLSLCSSGINCVPTSTPELIWAADGNCRLITGLKSPPNGSSCDLPLVILLTQGEHYLPAQHSYTFIPFDAVRARDTGEANRTWEKKAPLSEVIVPLLAWKDTSVERLDLIRPGCQSQVSLVMVRCSLFCHWSPVNHTII